MLHLLCLLSSTPRSADHEIRANGHELTATMAVRFSASLSLLVYIILRQRDPGQVRMVWVEKFCLPECYWLWSILTLLLLAIRKGAAASHFLCDAADECLFLVSSSTTPGEAYIREERDRLGAEVQDGNRIRTRTHQYNYLPLMTLVPLILFLLVSTTLQYSVNRLSLQRTLIYAPLLHISSPSLTPRYQILLQLYYTYRPCIPPLPFHISLSAGQFVNSLLHLVSFTCPTLSPSSSARLLLLLTPSSLPSFALFNRRAKPYSP